MNKILIIDDRTERWAEYAKDFRAYVVVSQRIEDYISFDPDGNNVAVKFSESTYLLIFIHHSQRGDSIIPSNILDSVKALMGFRLILFSGTLDNIFHNQENPGFPFNSLRRETMAARFKLFVGKSILMGSWELEILYYDFLTILKGRLMEQLDSGDLSTASLLGLREMDMLLKYQRVDKTSQLYLKLPEMLPEEVLTTLTQH
mgnify:CR=1 FL=1